MTEEECGHIQHLEKELERYMALRREHLVTQAEAANKIAILQEVAKAAEDVLLNNAGWKRLIDGLEKAKSAGLI